MLRTTLPVLLIALLLGGCAGLSDDPTKNWTPEQLYREAKDKMADGDYATAIKHFEALEARYPYGRYAEQAQLEIAYAYYKHDEPALAIAAAERFIRLHPTHPNVDYAYYLKGLVNFRLERTFLDWVTGGTDDLSDRDPKGAREAYNAFKELIERFPRSRYAEDAAARMAYLFDIQAKYEVKVAQFYYRKGAYVAAVNRCKQALENYPRTPSIEDALGIQALSYQQMGLTKLKNDTERVLKLNFPQSRYLQRLGEPDDKS
jgi:outer membrane protein assembly factor BamD